MPAVQETVEQVRRIDVDQYKYGFETLIRSDKAPKGLSEDTVRFISAKKNEPQWMLDWRLDAYRRWLTMREPTWARVRLSEDRLPGSTITTRRRSRRSRLKSLDEVDPEILKTYEKLGIPLREQEMLAGVVRPEGERRVAVDAVFDSVSVATTFQAELEEGRRDLHADLRSDPRASRTGAEVSRQRRAGDRQFLCDAELGGVLRRLVRLRAAGRALPDGAVDLFPHQREETPASSSAR